MLRGLAYLVVVMAAVSLSGCADMNRVAAKVADTATPEDAVTGDRSLNLESEHEEIQRTTKKTAEILAAAKKAGYGVDDKPEQVARLNAVFQRLVRVSHRPNLAWEIHLIDSPEVNAFTIGGGKVFVYEGLFGSLVDPANDDEIAVVLAHEIGHVAYRHAGKAMSTAEMAMLSKKVRSAVGSSLYRASYTTLQEQQADRVGLLYDALAGFNPSVAPAIWEVADKKFGSDPGKFLYDHPLSADRRNQLAAIVPVAMRYYRAEGVENPDYKKLLTDNKLIRHNKSSSGNGFVNLASGALGTYNDYLTAENEKRKRELALAERTRAIQQATQLSFNIAPTADGHQGLFGQVRNLGAQPITSLEIAVYYYAANGQILHTQPITLQSLQLPSGASTTWSGYLLAVPSSVRVAAAVVGGSLGQ